MVGLNLHFIKGTVSVFSRKPPIKMANPDSQRYSNITALFHILCKQIFFNCDFSTRMTSAFLLQENVS